MGTKELRMGIDVGSTTTKIIVIGEDGKELLFSDYERHHSVLYLTEKFGLFKTGRNDII